jgi:hypothetical protein
VDLKEKARGPSVICGTKRSCIKEMAGQQHFMLEALPKPY